MKAPVLRTVLPALPALPAAVAALLLGACAVAPPSAPAPQLPPQALALVEGERFAAAPPGAVPPSEAERRWWTGFDDPALAAAVAAALQAHPDIAIARERVAQARAVLAVAQAQRGPLVGAALAVEARNRRPAGTRAVQPSAALTLDWDLDLWGGLRQAEVSAAAQLMAAEHRAQAARLAVAGLSARAYVAWRAAQQQARLIADALALQREVQRVAGVRVEVGLSPRLDADRAAADLESLTAELAVAEVEARQAHAALRVLAGERPDVPGPAAAAPAAEADVPAWTRPLPASRPADLLRARPDLRAAEQALVAAAAEVGVAEAALWPRLTLPGTLALASGRGVLDLVSASLAAVLDGVLVDGGRARADVSAAEARLRETAQVYRLTLLQALQQADAAFVAAGGAAQRIAALQRAGEAANAALERARSLYGAGLVGLLDVLDAQRTWLAQRRALVAARADAALQAVAVFEALGLVDEAGDAPA